MVYEITQREKAASLFQGWEETLVWSCLQGVMGHLYGVTGNMHEDSSETPVSAMALLGDFCFFAGKPDRELVMYKPAWCEQDFLIMVPREEDWSGMIENCFGEKARKVSRYAIKKEPEIFGRTDEQERLQRAAARLPAGYELKMIDEALFYRCREIPWCRDWVAQYDDCVMFREYGLGVVICKDGEPVSGASSYSGYLGGMGGDTGCPGGIEIEIDTREDYRRKGLAYICGAKLILECCKKGWYPSWDAQNLWSVALAEKLGYHFSHAYTAYEIQGW